MKFSTSLTQKLSTRKKNHLDINYSHSMPIISISFFVNNIYPYLINLLISSVCVCVQASDFVLHFLTSVCSIYKEWINFLYFQISWRCFKFFCLSVSGSGCVYAYVLYPDNFKDRPENVFCKWTKQYVLYVYVNNVYRVQHRNHRELNVEL